ncbi:MAG: hypothetical protein ABIF10_01470 [Candidatus Woesearchaeota archaeon]
MNSIGAEEQKKGLFGHEKKKDSSPDILAEVNMIGRRLRVLEEQHTNLRRKMQVTDQNMLSYNKKNITEIRTVNMEINELRRTIEDVQSNILLIIKELRLCAKKEEVNVLQKYINMWEPVNFVTRLEVERIVEDSLHKRDR